MIKTFKSVFAQPFFWTSMCCLLAISTLVGLYAYGWVAPTASPNSNAGAIINVSGNNVGIGITPTAPLHILGTKIKLVDTNTLGLASEVNGQLLDYGANYFQLGDRINATAGGFFRIDLRDSVPDEFFNIKYLAPGVTSALGETTPLKMSRTGDLVLTGNITAGTITGSAFYYSSDANLKTDIQEIENPLAKIMKLDGVSFNWKENSKPSIGLIAQDVEKVFPEIVQTDKQTGLKSVEYGNLIAPLIEAVKEQQKMIDAQRELINQQGEEIKSLKIWLEQL